MLLLLLLRLRVDVVGAGAISRVDLLVRGERRPVYRVLLEVLVGRGVDEGRLHDFVVVVVRLLVVVLLVMVLRVVLV